MTISFSTTLDGGDDGFQSGVRGTHHSNENPFACVHAMISLYPSFLERQHRFSVGVMLQSNARIIKAVIFPNCLTALFMALLITIGCGQALAQDMQKSAIKAEATLRFVEHVTWPREALFNSINIAFIGRDPTYFRELKAAIAQRQVRGKAIQLTNIKLTRDLTKNQALLKSIHVLIVAENTDLSFPEIAFNARNTNTLLISSEEKDHLRIMINFFLASDDTLTFEFNRSNILLEKLTINKDILLAGGSELDVADLFRETEYQLQKMKQSSRRQEQRLIAQDQRLDSQETKLGQQSRQLVQQTGKISQREGLIDRQIEQINQQQQTLSAKESQFNLLTRELDQAANMLEGKQKQLISSQEDLNVKQADLKEKESKVLSLSELIQANNRILGEQQQALAQQSQQMSQLQGTIGQQKTLILSALAIIGAFAVLLLIILRINKARKHANTELASSNNALKDTQHQLQKAKQSAEVANRAKSTFLSNMSHEIRTPMNAILGFSQLMQQNPLLPQSVVQRNLEVINSSGEHLLLLINDILEMSKIEAGRVTLNPEHFDITVLLHDIEKMFQFPCEEKNIELLVEYDDALPRLLYCDRRKVSQMLINLLGNAVKFTQTGGISLRVSTASSLQPSGDPAPGGQATGGEGREPGEATEIKLIIEVQDSGCGIDPRDYGKVFGSFEQSHSGKSSGQGTGLGLSITREYAHLMGGDVTFSSELDKGCIFRLELQCEPGDSTQVLAVQKPRQVMGLAPGSPSKRILVVDDSKNNRDLLIQLLSPIGFELLEAVNGEQALEQFTRNTPDLILMDDRMPVMTGTQAIVKIRATTIGAQLPIIVISASAFDEDRKRLLAAGANGFIAKPFKGSEVLETIGGLLQLKYRYEDIIEAPPTTSRAELAQSIAKLPQQIIADLRNAVIKCDTVQLRRLIALIEGGGNSDHRYKPQKGLAQTLTLLSEGFNFEAMDELLK